MKKAEMITEHKRLVKVLMSGSKKERVKEGKKQEKELRRLLGK